MTRFGTWFGMGVFFVVSSATVSGAPLAAYGRLPTLDDLAISPNGKALAYATDIESKRVIVISAIDNPKIIAALNAGDQKVRELRWADNNRLLITTSRTTIISDVIAPRQEYSGVICYDISTNESHPLLTNVPDSLNVSLGLPESRTVNGHTVVFMHGIHFIENQGVTALFAADLDTGRNFIVESGSDNADEWWVDENGQVVAEEDYDDNKKLWSLKILHGRQLIKTFGEESAIDRPSVFGITADGASLVVNKVGPAGFATTFLNLADGSETNSLDAEKMFGSAVEDPSTHRIIGSQGSGAKTEYVFFNQDDQLAWNSVASAFPDENVTLISWSSDRKRVVVLVDGTRNGAEYELVDLNTERAVPIGSAYRDVAASEIAVQEFIHYPAADGTSIPAYLTLPRGVPAKGLPLIVFPHGGPLAQDEPGFDWWAQAMTSRGYAVLQPEFRGSDGFGWKHTLAGFGEWGRKMQTDLSDGVRYLAKQGTVDPKRVCIVGASYGGYAALAGPTLDRGIYRCAVSVGGISDPISFLQWVRHRTSSSDSLPLRFWTRFMGVESYDDTKLKNISPLVHVADSDSPILLIHGSDDTVVPIEQSEDMADALKAAGKPVEFVKLKSEDHWLSRSETREQMLAATVEFLERNNPPN